MIHKDISVGVDSIAFTIKGHHANEIINWFLKFKYIRYCKSLKDKPSLKSIKTDRTIFSCYDGRKYGYKFTVIKFYGMNQYNVSLNEHFKYYRAFITYNLKNENMLILKYFHFNIDFKHIENKDFIKEISNSRIKRTKDILVFNEKKYENESFYLRGFNNVSINTYKCSYELIQELRKNAIHIWDKFDLESALEEMFIKYKNGTLTKPSIKEMLGRQTIPFNDELKSFFNKLLEVDNIIWNGRILNKLFDKELFKKLPINGYIDFNGKLIIEYNLYLKHKSIFNKFKLDVIYPETNDLLVYDKTHKINTDKTDDFIDYNWLRLEYKYNVNKPFFQFKKENFIKFLNNFYFEIDLLGTVYKGNTMDLFNENNRINNIIKKFFY
ncbi:hypothetical protein [Arcobacter sp.]|uniref:hypothetical protein n=1 Tax=Arcobacter sp. TaxID=1872629 RepID=UPI003C70FF6B